MIIFLLILLILLNGFFAMSELALVSARQARLHQMVDEKSAGAKTALELKDNPNQFLSTIQIGISLVGVLSGAIGGATLAEPLALYLSKIELVKPISNQLSVGIVVILITYFSLVIGELIPKRLAMGNAENIAAGVSGFMKILSSLTSPLVKLLSSSTEFGLRIFGVQNEEESSVSEEEIKILIEQGTRSGVFDETEQDMVEGILRLGNRRVDAIMVPHTEIEWLDINEPFDKNLEIAMQSPYSRFPIAEDQLDNIIGIVHIRDLLSMKKGNQTALDIRKIMLVPPFVPESMPALKVLEHIKESGVHIAIVIDEFSGVVGMVTLFDILESIVGEIPAAGEDNDSAVSIRSDGSYLVDGMLRIDDFKDTFALDELPDEERVGFQTLAGFIMNYLGAIPETGQKFEWNNLQFEIIDMDSRRIDKILITPAGSFPSENDVADFV